MIEYLIWGLSFVTLYFTIVLISILYLDKEEISGDGKIEYPYVTVAIPFYNESINVKETIVSALGLDYPKDKIKIIIINDGSTDDTLEVVKATLRENPLRDVTIINKNVNEGKAAALNTVLERSETELFACLDADSVVDRKALIQVVPHFRKLNTAAVVTAIRIYNPKNVYEHLQRLEYIVTILARKIMTLMNTLHVTPGVLSVYKTDVLKKVGGFDRYNITEDFEIALRLKSEGYDVELESNALTFTKAPNNFKSLWNQRIRWYRGFFQNYYRYRHLLFNRKYGFLGIFQLPLNIIGVAILLISLGLSLYMMLTHFTETIIRSVTIPGYFFGLFSMPTMEQFILSQNFKLMFPIFIASILGLYMFYLAHKHTKEKLWYPISIWLYLIVFPFITCAHWIGAMTHEIFRTKRKW